jgi:hypothetical protein
MFLLHLALANIGHFVNRKQSLYLAMPSLCRTLGKLLFVSNDSQFVLNSTVCVALITFKILFFKVQEHLRGKTES